MRQLTANEIRRTAFKRVSPSFNSVFGYSREEVRNGSVDKSEICPYCKNEYTDVIRDKAYLKDFDDVFKPQHKQYKVLNCSACTAVFSVYWE